MFRLLNEIFLLFAKGEKKLIVLMYNVTFNLPVQDTHW